MSDLSLAELPRELSPSLLPLARKTRVREAKYAVPGHLADAVRQWMRRHLRPDPYASGPFGDEYSTSTLYLDTPRLGILLRAPDAGRSKYRVRRYEGSGFVFLERKLRLPDRILKHRSLLPEDALARLGESDFRDEAGCEWFRRRMQAKGLSPVCRVSYERTARQCTLAGGPVRLTLDCSLRARRADGFDFGESVETPVPGGFAVLEMKYAGDLPPLLKSLLEAFPLTPVRLSKYREACVALNLCDAATLRAAGRPLPIFSHE